jgi:hypothetical protein
VRRSGEDAMLYRQYARAIAGEDVGYCLGEVGVPGAAGAPGAAGGEGHCLGCGACTTAEERAAITDHAMQHPGAGYLRELEQMMQEKWRLQPVYARVWLPPQAAGTDPAWINALIMRAILQAHPELTDNLLAVQESLFTTRANATSYTGLRLFGETVVALKAWDPAQVIDTLTEEEALPDDLRFLDHLPAQPTFTPGDFARATLHLSLPAAHFPDAGRALRQYLQDQYVPVNLRGAAEGYVFDIPAKALKKRVIFAGRFQENERRTETEIAVSPKFDLVGYLASFTEPGRYREARVEVRARALSGSGG